MTCVYGANFIVNALAMLGEVKTLASVSRLNGGYWQFHAKKWTIFPYLMHQQTTFDQIAKSY